MGHKEHFHGLSSVQHGPIAPLDHISNPFEEGDAINPGDLSDAGRGPWEMLWIDIGGEG